MVRGEVEKFSGVRALDGNLTSKEKINIFYNWHNDADDEKSLEFPSALSPNAPIGKTLSRRPQSREPAAWWESFCAIVLECDVAVCFNFRGKKLHWYTTPQCTHCNQHKHQFPMNFRIDFHLRFRLSSPFWASQMSYFKFGLSWFRLFCSLGKLYWKLDLIFMSFEEIFDNFNWFEFNKNLFVQNIFL